jgi:wobble nucleotide-excising tRNase
MIHKIERLNCIGKFRSYSATGDVAFKKLTLVYADNGSGKTTLTSVLRSVNQNDPEIIRRRKSTNLSTAQGAQIVQRNSGVDTHHTFNTTGWITVFPNIEIFDIHFVNENIFSGFYFNEDHKKQLHQFVIGAQGISIQQQIEKNKADKAASKLLQASIEQLILQQVGNNLTADKITRYLAITSTPPNINQLIADAGIALTNASSNSVIQTLQPLTTLANLNTGIDFSILKTDLATATDTIKIEALQALFEEHCKDLSENSIESPDSWLEKGMSYLHVKTSSQQSEAESLHCPFCKQEINSSLEIINAYSLKFNEVFNKLVSTIETHLANFKTFNLEVGIQSLNSINQINTPKIASWATYLPTTVQAPIFNIVTNEENLKAEFRSLISLVQEKLQNPSQSVTTEAISTFENSLNTINSNISIYNQAVIAHNNCITTFRSTIQTVQQAQSEVDRLNCINLRFSTTLAPLCNQLITERQNLKALEIAYPLLIQQQEAVATSFFASYQTRINYYLSTVFKTLFRIDNVTNIAPQGRSTQSKLGYKLTIDGQDISFDSTQQTNAKDCLSEGDKSTLALAFFLSKLDVDPGIADKIIVFDDPLSSFDSNRRLYTVQLLTGLLTRVKQVVVLSHNENFLHLISKSVSAGDKKTLRITENFITNASIIEPLDIEKLVENDYFKHVKELEDFLSHADITKKDTVLGWMRNVLEAHIRFKFYRQVSHIAPNNRTFGTLITTLDNNSVPFRNNANRVIILQKLRLINGVSCKPHHGEPNPDYVALGVDPTAMNVVELSHLVQDTLDLIDNQL